MATRNLIKQFGRSVIYWITPELIVVLHFGILLWVLLGTVAMFFYSYYIGTHMIFLSLVLLFGLFLGYCPLTKIEEKLRRKQNSRFTLNNSFITHYLNKLFRTDYSVTQINNFQWTVYIFSYIAAAYLYFVR